MRPVIAAALVALLPWLPGAARAACPVAAPAGLVSPGRLSFGTTNPPPAPGLKPINLAGFEYDFSVALARTMCLKPGYTVLAFAGLFPALDAHKFDLAIAGIGITAQRAQSFRVRALFPRRHPAAGAQGERSLLPRRGRGVRAQYRRPRRLGGGARHRQIPAHLSARPEDGGAHPAQQQRDRGAASQGHGAGGVSRLGAGGRHRRAQSG